VTDRDRTVPVRSYRDVVDVVERRIFRVDRWRVPHPGGIPAAALGYFIAALGVVLAGSRLPLLGGLLAMMQPALRFVGLPAICAWALVSWQIDGRRPHHALFSVLRHRLAPRTLAGLRRAPAVGTWLAPVDGATIAPSGDEPRYRAGRVRGPATLILRYPAELRVERRRFRRRADAGEAIATARRLRVRPVSGRSRPLAEGRAIRVPEGAEVVFE
jgi:hypothetical protein